MRSSILRMGLPLWCSGKVVAFQLLTFSWFQLWSKHYDYQSSYQQVSSDMSSLPLIIIWSWTLHTLINSNKISMTLQSLSVIFAHFHSMASIMLDNYVLNLGISDVIYWYFTRITRNQIPYWLLVVQINLVTCCFYLVYMMKVIIVFVFKILIGWEKKHQRCVNRTQSRKEDTEEREEKGPCSAADKGIMKFLRKNRKLIFKNMNVAYK